jgi:hypothetical protein
MSPLSRNTELDALRWCLLRAVYGQRFDGMLLPGNAFRLLICILDHVHVIPGTECRELITSSGRGA